MCRRILISLAFFVYAVTALPDMLTQCSLKNSIDKFINCATITVLKTLERAEEKNSFVLMPGFTLERNTSSARTAKELHLNLPEDLNNQTTAVFEILLEATGRFMSDRILKIEIPLNGSENVARSLVEGRGKKKKMMGLMGPLFFGLGAKMMSMVPVMFGGVFLLASKALIVGKIALVISALLFLQFFFNGRLFSSGGTYGIPPTYGVPNTVGTSYGYGTNSLGGGWGTSAQYPYP